MAIEAYIGAAVPGGYAPNRFRGGDVRSRPLTDYDAIATLKNEQGQTVTPRYWVTKEVLAPEAAQTRQKGFGAEFEAVVSKWRRGEKREDLADAAERLVPLLSDKAKEALSRNQLDPTTAMVPVTGTLVRGVTGGELGLAKGVYPKVGESIPLSSARGSAISTNPVSQLGDTASYVRGKVNSGQPAHAGKDAYVIVYPPEVMEGVSIGSLGKDSIDGIEAHLATNIDRRGKEYRDPNVVVSRHEVIASPRRDLVVRGVYPSPEDPNLIFVLMGN